MIRVTVVTCDASMAANVGGPVEQVTKSFDIESPALEAHLREYQESFETEKARVANLNTRRKHTPPVSLTWYASQTVVGWELLPEVRKESKVNNA